MRSILLVNDPDLSFAEGDLNVQDNGTCIAYLIFELDLVFVSPIYFFYMSYFDRKSLPKCNLFHDLTMLIECN